MVRFLKRQEHYSSKMLPPLSGLRRINMKLISLKCPECSSNLQIEEGRDKCFCQYCGAEISLNDYYSSHIYRKVDEARIKEAEYKKEVRVKQAEIDKEVRLKELEVEARRTKSSIIRVVVKLIAFAILVIVAAIFDVVGSTNYDLRGLANTAALILVMAPIVLIFLFLSEKK